MNITCPLFNHLYNLVIIQVNTRLVLVYVNSLNTRLLQVYVNSQVNTRLVPGDIDVKIFQ